MTERREQAGHATRPALREEALVSDLVVFPHCDLHVSLAHAPQLKIEVRRRNDGANPATDPYSLGAAPVTGACQFDFFAPDLAVGHRFDNLPTVAGDGTVTATTVGRYLFQVRFTTGAAPNQSTHYLVGSLQVHSDILGWWFGHTSLTTALDTTIGHSLPSVYAKFSDDGAAGTDVIGDISGHGYVPLTSADTGKVVVMPNGRLRGVAEGSTTVSGTFLGATNTLPVRAVDYGRPDKSLFPIQAPNVANFAQMHNVVFLAEGFRTEDQPRFDKLVTTTVKELYDTQRHQPYPMLEGSFNNFKVFSASRELALTPGYRVMAQAAGNLAKGTPIPFEGAVSATATVFTPAVLVSKVGLPKRGEARSRADLVAEWQAKKLIQPADAARIDDTLVTVWKALHSDGILDARDTFFGMMLSRRPGDRKSAREGAPVARPPTDTPGAGLDAFVARVYEFYRFPLARLFEADPRRHPPELYAGSGEANPASSIMRFLAAQSYTYPPHHAIGPAWLPDQTTFKPSRGLVALIGQDLLIGGQNINDSTVTAQTLGREGVLSYVVEAAGQVTRVRRDPPVFEPDPDILVNTVAHEFGHSFALADEYEGNDGDDPQSGLTSDYPYDNATFLGVIHLTGGGARDIDPAKVKWLGLPRMAASERLLADSVAQAGGIDVLIDHRHVARWKKAMVGGEQVGLRAADIAPTGVQLPLKSDATHVLTNLRVTSVDETTGLLRLGGPGLPGAPATFKAGAHIYIPLLDGATPKTVGQQKVIDFIRTSKNPLNVDTNRLTSSSSFDNPVDIPGFSAPCTSSRLVGVYEGAVQYSGGDFRPAGQCKMRASSESDSGGEGEFCFVCKWLIVNNVDPGMHAVLDHLFYPRSKRNG
jgi:hypothetical protein